MKKSALLLGLLFCSFIQAMMLPGLKVQQFFKKGSEFSKMPKLSIIQAVHAQQQRTAFTIKKTNQVFLPIEDQFLSTSFFDKIFLPIKKNSKESKKKEIYITFLKLHGHMNKTGFIIPLIMQDGELKNHIVPFNETIDETSGSIIMSVWLADKLFDKTFCFNIPKSLQCLTIYLEEIKQLYRIVLNAKAIAKDLDLKEEFNDCEKALHYVADMLNVVEGLRKELFSLVHTVKNVRLSELD